MYTEVIALLYQNSAFRNL